MFDDSTGTLRINQNSFLSAGGGHLLGEHNLSPGRAHPKGGYAARLNGIGYDGLGIYRPTHSPASNKKGW